MIQTISRYYPTDDSIINIFDMFYVFCNVNVKLCVFKMSKIKNMLNLSY